MSQVAALRSCSSLQLTQVLNNAGQPFVSATLTLQEVLRFRTSIIQPKVGFPLGVLAAQQEPEMLYQGPGGQTG